MLAPLIAIIDAEMRGIGLNAEALQVRAKADGRQAERERLRLERKLARVQPRRKNRRRRK